MYHRFLTGISSVLFAISIFAVAGCNDEVNGPSENVGTIFSITVGTGLQPSYTWDGGPASRIEIVRMDDLGTIVWGFETPNTNGVASPVQHSVIPASANTIETDENTLNEGVTYRVTVRRENGGFGRTTFTR